jgi:4-hydroxy-tetrahydrodipicolinate synthase
MESYLRVVDYAVAAEADGLVYPANASEFFTLTDIERRELTETLIQRVDTRVPVIVGVSSADGASAASLADHAAKNGAGGLLVLAHARFKNQPARLLAYLRCIASRTDLPVILQNAPTPLGADLSVQEIAEIVDAIPAIEFIKEEASPSGQRISRLQQCAGSSVKGIFGGDGGRSLLNELPRGIVGTMPSVELTELFSRLYRRYSEGAVGEAADIFHGMLPLLNFQRVFRWAMTKKILQWRGVIEDDFVRVPEAPALDPYDMEELKMWYERIREAAWDERGNKVKPQRNGDDR